MDIDTDIYTIVSIQERSRILQAYLEAVDFTDGEHEEYSDRVIGFSNELEKVANTDIDDFILLCVRQEIDWQGVVSPEQFGHDFWLTRNGHGAGFWDRGLGALGSELSEAARSFGTVDVYEGGDNWLYFS